MVNYTMVIALVALVGIASAYPPVRSHRQTVDEDVQVSEENTVDDVTDAPNAAPIVSEAPATLSPRIASDDNEIYGSDEDNALGLPSNATSIRAQITDTFSCEGRVYGYYADVENECQVFHVCLPVVVYAGKSQTYKWSFICPAQTIFNQESFTCTRPEDSVACEEAPQYYKLNDNFGVTTERANVDLSSRSGLASISDASDSKASSGDLTNVVDSEVAISNSSSSADDSSETEVTTQKAESEDES